MNLEMVVWPFLHDLAPPDKKAPKQQLRLDRLLRPTQTGLERLGEAGRPATCEVKRR